LRGDLNAIVAELHADALAAARAGLLTQYESVCGVYLELLTQFPEAWSSYGQRFTNALAEDLELIGMTPFKAIVRNLSDEFEEIASVSVRGVADEAVGLAFRAAGRSVGGGCSWPLGGHAVALAPRLRSWTQAQRAGRGTVHGPACPTTLLGAWAYYAASRVTSDQLPMDARELAADLLRELSPSRTRC